MNKFICPKTQRQCSGTCTSPVSCHLQDDEEIVTESKTTYNYDDPSGDYDDDYKGTW